MRCIIVILNLLMAGLLCGQIQTFKVLDAEDQTPLPFARVEVKGTNTRTTTDSDGGFSLEKLNLEDTLLIRYMGYKSAHITFSELKRQEKIYLKPEIVKLDEVEILSENISAEEIIESVYKRFHANHPITNHKQEIYFHKFEQTPFTNENKIQLKKVDFKGLNKTVVEDFIKKLPDEFTESQDVVLNLYSFGGNHKIEIKQGIYLERASVEQLSREFEENFKPFFSEVEKSVIDEDTYFKFKTGILGMKLGKQMDSSWSMPAYDSAHYPIPSDFIKAEVLYLEDKYTNPNSKNLEFLNKTKRYNYKKEGLIVLDNELVYRISFLPEKNGLFKGEIYVSTENFAILQIDFNYAEGKSSENIQLFGIGHSMKYKGANLIYHREKKGYFLKYLSVTQNEKVSVDRKVSIKRKEKRFLFDKETDEIKLDLDLIFDILTNWEILVLQREEIHKKDFTKVNPTKTVLFSKKILADSTTWETITPITPINELKEFRKKE